MRMIKGIDKWLCLHSKGYKLWRISEALGIKPYEWQRAFALGETNSISATTRRSGKTMAVMLRLLMLKPDAPDDFMWHILRLDPDYAMIVPTARAAWYRREYRKYSTICDKAGIPVVMLAPDGLRTNFSFVDEWDEWGRNRGGN